MSHIIISQAFRDTFAHLGEMITYETNTGGQTPVLALIQAPENVYDLGSVGVVQDVANITILTDAGVTPHIGDFFIIKSKKYKIYNEPLNRRYIWNIDAVLS